MASQDHLDILARGPEAWNRWRVAHPHLQPDLSGAHLRGAKLRYVRLDRADFTGTNLTEVSLAGADLRSAVLRESVLDRAILTGADLGGADLARASLVEARLVGSTLAGANLTGANLQDADFEGVVLKETVFSGSCLTGARNLDRCVHAGLSYLDSRTYARSRGLHPVFLHGCGLLEWEIESYKLFEPGLDRAGIARINDRVQAMARTAPAGFYSCFMSYNRHDHRFAKRLYRDLKLHGVPCFWAPEDMRIGDEISDVIHQQIIARERLLLVLSTSSVESAWVEAEVKHAMARERSRRAQVLFPIRIDDAVLHPARPWAESILDRRHIGDFTGWQNEHRYAAALRRLLRDLARAEPPDPFHSAPSR